MDTLTITLRFFGSFRRHGDSVELNLQAPGTLHDLRATLIEKLGEAEADLVADSAFANDDKILPESYGLHRDHVLSILPPVCGG